MKKEISLEELKTATEWCRVEDVSIVSPDGWRYQDAANEFFAKPITLKEFREKLHQCTTKKGFEPKYEEALRAQLEAVI